MLDALAARPVLVAAFHAGTTAGGHHWTLEDGEGAVLARTRRVHTGGMLARAAWKTVTLVGMDAGNDIHAELRGEDGETIARFESRNAKPATVTAADPAGLAIAESVHADGRLELRSDGRTVASVELTGEGPWPALGATGEPLGELLAGAPGRSTTAGWVDILVPVAPTNSADFARTMHLGVRRVTTYAFRRDAPRVPPAVALLPLLAGLSY